MAPNKKSKTSKKKSNKTLLLAIGIIAIVLIGIGVYVILGQSTNQPANSTPTPTPSSSPSVSPPPNPNATRVLLQTSVGNITLEMRTDKPITTTNFLTLVREGKYDGTTFHRIVSGFMIQGGIISGSTPAIPDEIGSNNRNSLYTIAMAKTNDPNSATSQFFINVADNGAKYAPSFDATYTVFGNVTTGQEVV